MKLYLAGKMTGMPDYNRPVLAEAAKTLRKEKHVVYNPGEAPSGLTYREYITRSMNWICNNAEGIVMLPGWEFSPGARAEYALAEALGLHIWYWPAKPLTQHANLSKE